MNTLEVIVVVLLALLGGAGLLAMGLFFWYLLKTMKRVEESIGEFVRVLDPLVKTGSLQKLSGASISLVDLGAQVVSAMRSMEKTVSVFNKLIFKPEVNGSEPRPFSPETPAEEYAAPGESLKVSYSEETAAHTERSEYLKRMGVPTDEGGVVEPREEQMHGSSV